MDVFFDWKLIKKIKCKVSPDIQKELYREAVYNKEFMKNLIIVVQQ